MFNMQLDTIDKFISEINRLQVGYDLLQQVYLEAGGYGEESMSDELRYKINNFFGFDDSE